MICSKSPSELAGEPGLEMAPLDRQGWALPHPCTDDPLDLTPAQMTHRSRDTAPDLSSLQWMRQIGMQAWWALANLAEGTLQSE